MSDINSGIRFIKGDYDFGDLLEGVNPNTVATDNYNFGELELDDENTYGDYNFGNVDKIGNINLLLQKLIEDAIRDTLSKGKIKLIRLTTNKMFTPIIGIQYYYREETNKVFIEFQYNDKFRHLYDTPSITPKIINYINCNFKRIADAWPEIILIEDGKNEICDSYANLTPFTIGYWKSLSSERYEFIADKAEVNHDSSSINFPSYPKEYLKKRETIIEENADNYQLMIDKLYELDEEYNISLDQKPDKSFNDFINAIADIRSKYTQVNLSEDDKMNYINEYNQISIQYKGSEEFNIKLNELNDKYGIISNLNSYIPEMFELYNQTYYQFFKRILPDINQYTYKYFVEIKENV